MNLLTHARFALSLTASSLCLMGCAGSAFHSQRSRQANLESNRASIVSEPKSGSTPIDSVTGNTTPTSDSNASLPNDNQTRVVACIEQDSGGQSTPIIAAQALYLPSDDLAITGSGPANHRFPQALNLETTELRTSASAVSESDQVNAEGLARQLHWMGDYQIETGDSLEIKFRVTKELNDIVTVRPDGMISLQLVGDQPAKGLTPEQLREQLQAAYSKDIVTPDLAVIVRSFSGNSIYVGGEVNSPVRVPLTGRVTTLKAVILAGGFKDTADRKRVVVRHEDGTCCQYDLKSVIECKSTGQDIELRPYDIVYVPKSRIAKVNLFVEQYIDKVLPFSRSFGVFVSHNTGLTGGMVGP